MSKQIDFNKYTEFVKAVSSEPTNNVDAMINRITELANNYPNLNISLMMNSAIGLGSEGGEVEEVIKKVIWQGKELNEETVFHLKRELGDVIWYWTNMCRALGFKPEDIIAENVNKLESRYPGGKFDVHCSENRKEGDL
jgi:NTP pyrophosphatase (non-canonical NTP hydrolase)